jgi:hypothetical protein
MIKISNMKQKDRSVENQKEKRHASRSLHYYSKNPASTQVFKNHTPFDLNYSPQNGNLQKKIASFSKIRSSPSHSSNPYRTQGKTAYHTQGDFRKGAKLQNKKFEMLFRPVSAKLHSRDPKKQR